MVTLLRNHGVGIRRLATLTVALALSLAVWRLADQPAAAQRSASQSSCCVATINLNRVLEKLDERTEREKELQALITKLEADLKSLADQGRVLEEDLRILPQASQEWREKRNQAVRIAARLQAEREASQAIALDSQKRIQMDLFRKIREATARYAEREGFMLVINDDGDINIPEGANEQQVQAAILGRRVIFASPAVDISEAVSRMMNTEFKGR